ncbi:MAG: M14-type cytosolic carboxypeptidase, partial [Ignavibacteria bacterium]|nr:M14-type cytosolic carboxypeptidase [Ignavibacteria bacterium]
MRNSFTIIHFFFLVCVLRSQVIFDSNFDSGNLETVTTTDSINFVVTSRADIVGRWFYFKMKNVNGKYVSVRVSNSDVVRPMYSYDNINWQRFSQSECPSKNVFQKTYTNDSVYVAYYIPFSFTSLQKKLQEWKEKPYSKIDTIGYSEQNRPLQLITIKDYTYADSLKFNIWIHGRTHPSETPSSFHLNGMIEFLLSDNEIAQHLRERINFFILPFINPDGVYLGKSRVNAKNIDLERQWNLPDSSTPKEVISAKKFLSSILSKKNISVALNMHSQAADFATFWIHTASSTSNFFYRREIQFANLQSANSPYIAQSDFSYSNLQAYFPEGWFWANWGDSIMALTYETPYTKFSNNVWIDNSILYELGKQTVFGIMEYLGINHPKRFILDNSNAFVVGSWLKSTLYTNFYGDDYLQITPSFLDNYVEWHSNLLSKGKYY